MRPTPGWVWRSRAISSRHLVAGELAALARLRALGHLDLELVGEGAVLGRDAEAAGRDLLDAAVLVVDGLAARAEAVRGPRRPRRSSTLPPIRFMASARVSCASADSEPCDMAPVEKRRVMAVRRLDLVERRPAGPAARSSSRSCSSVGGPVVDQRGELVVGLVARRPAIGPLQEVRPAFIVVAAAFDHVVVVGVVLAAACGPGRSRASPRPELGVAGRTSSPSAAQPMPADDRRRAGEAGVDHLGAEADRPRRSARRGRSRRWRSPSST